MADGRESLRANPQGWAIVSSTFLLVFLGFGAAYSFTAFFPSLESEFNASREDVSFIFSIAGFLYFALGALSGALADKLGTRPIVIFGVTVAGSGLLLTSQAETLLETYLTFGLGIGVGLGFAYVPAVAAVQRWFTTQRGKAGGIAVAGIGAGTLAGPPIADWLIEIEGWRNAYVYMGLAVLALGAAAASRIDDPDHHKRARNTVSPRAAGDGVGAALRSRRFILFWLASFILSLGLFVPFVHLVPYAIDRNLGAATGVLLLSLIGLGSTAGRFVLAGLADRFGRKRSLTLMFAGVGAMDLIWLAHPSEPGLYLFAVIFGLCYGGYVGTAPSVTADMFGTRMLSSILGWLYTSVAVGTLVGPPLAGRAFDAFQSYDLPILVGSICGFLAAGTMLLIDPKPIANYVAD